MSKVKYLSQRKYYSSISNKIITNVTIDPISTETPQKIKVNALWDTGATISAISTRIARSLNLIPISIEPIMGIHEKTDHEIVYVSILFEYDFLLEMIRTAICDLNPDFDFIIGMNAISKGDFSISNGGNNTLFSFVVPPFITKTDHYEKAFTLNKRNKLY